MPTSHNRAPDVKIAWKYLWTSKDTWLGPTLNIGAIGSTYNLTMDPYEKYDMMFNGAVSTRNPTTSPGRYAGMDNGWVFSLVDIPLTEFNKSIVKYPNIERFPGGASNDHEAESAEPEKSIALRSDHGAEDHRRGWRLDTASATMRAPAIRNQFGMSATFRIWQLLRHADGPRIMSACGVRPEVSCTQSKRRD